MKRLVLQLIGLALGVVGAVANGGAYITGVPSTGSGAAEIQEQEPTTVKLEEERVHIRLFQEFAEVEVDYRMFNDGPARKQPFYFPIRQLVRASMPIVHRPLPVRVLDYAIAAGGKTLAWSDVDGKGQPWPVADSVKPAVARPVEAENIWKRSEIAFAGQQRQEIRIRYRAPYVRDSAFFSDDSESQSAYFHYQLSPAATWNGPIGKGDVVIWCARDEEG